MIHYGRRTNLVFPREKEHTDNNVKKEWLLKISLMLYPDQLKVWLWILRKIFALHLFIKSITVDINVNNLLPQKRAQHGIFRKISVKRKFRILLIRYLTQYMNLFKQMEKKPLLKTLSFKDTKCARPVFLRKNIVQICSIFAFWIS